MMKLLVRLGLLAGTLSWLGGCAMFTETENDFDLVSTPPESALVTPPSAGPVPPLMITHGPRVAKRVALTFDACSTKSPSQYDERVAKILVDEHIPATIFLGGKWMEEHPDHTRYLASLPQFELANHSYLHPHLTKVSDERLSSELQKTQDTLFALTGRRATLFRAPYGEISPKTVKLAAAAGLVTVQFDLASGDADKNVSSQKLIEYVSTMTKSGSIVVMHINGRGWHTAEALPEIITRLRARGFEFVTVSQLITDDPQPTPTPDEPLRDITAPTVEAPPAGAIK
jgi:peptidoglycan/xylan/chitin deacetylase (PgdA/CDA1 family)